MTRINTNVSSLVAQTTLARSNSQLQESLTRLSTGLRINTGKDDPAGLIASESLRRDILAVTKAISNSQRANQMIATADSALSQVSNLLNDIRGLVTEAANKGVLSSEQIAANQLQVDSSLEAIDRIAQVTTFQGRKLLDGSLDFLTNITVGASSIVDLNIQKANLGTAQQINVSVDITAAASRAMITNAGGVGFTAGAEAEGTITFTDVTTPGQQAAATLAIGGGGTIDIDAVAGGAADGVVGNATSIVLARASGAATASATLAVGGGGTIDIDAVANTAVDGTVGNATSITMTRASDAALATGTLTLTNTTGSINIGTVANTATDGADGNGLTVVLQSGGSTAASYDANTNTLTVDVAGGADVDAIAAAINGLAMFTASAATGGSTAYDVNDNGTVNNVTTGGADGTTGATYNSGTNTIEVAVAVGATVTNVAAAIDGLTQFSAAAATNGTNAIVSGDLTTHSGEFSGGANGTTAATYDSGTNTINVGVAVGGTVANVATAIDGLAAFDAAVASNGSNAVVSGDLTTHANEFSGGVDEVAVDDEITITSNSTGTAYNGTLTFASSGAVGANQVQVQQNGANITVTVNNTSTYDLATLTNQIQSQLSGYTVALTGTAADGTYNAATDAAPTTTNLTGGTNDTGTGLAADVVVKLTGLNGSEAFNFASGTTMAQIIEAINLVSDATGVAAATDGNNLLLRSSQYGSEAYVDVEVISEGNGGTFASGLSTSRASGADIVATINGTRALGRGNTMSINTATLNLDMTVAEGSSSDINLTITGGGAQFQLGPEVVSNQQARIAIQSVSTAKLGGVSGRLYELRSGGAASLANDTTAAANIVDAAITKVTEMRGRYGAFQRTTLDTNIASLNDTLVNITEAQSSIRDADFAMETAKLTRAQILVQSGTAVLQIANQNPQNVLSLLRG